MSIQPRQKTRLEIDELRKEVLRAQQMTDRDRFFAGAELFEFAHRTASLLFPSGL